MKIKVRREQNKRASQETNRKNCQNRCERLPPAHTAVLLQRQPRTASVPRAVHGHNEKLQKGASEAEGPPPVASLSDKGARAQRGPGEGAASRRGARNGTRHGPRGQCSPHSAREMAALLLAASGAALLRGRSPRSRVLNLSV